MPRSKWKPIYFSATLANIIRSADLEQSSKFKKKHKIHTHKKIFTSSRSSTILPSLNYLTCIVYNGKRYIPVEISSDRIGKKLGEFARTRTSNINKKK